MPRWYTHSLHSLQKGHTDEKTSQICCVRASSSLQMSRESHKAKMKRIPDEAASMAHGELKP